MSTIWWSDFCGNRSLYDAFWSYEISVNTTFPDVTSCFQKTLLTWMPCGLYILSAMAYLVYLTPRPSLHNCTSLSRFSILKLGLSIGMLLFTCLDLIFMLSVDTYPTYPLGMPVDWVYFFIKITALTFLIFIGTFEFKKGVNSSAVQFLFLLFLFGCEIMTLRSNVYRHKNGDPLLVDEYYATYILYFTVLSARFLCEFFPDNAAQEPSTGWRYSPMMSDNENVPLLNGKNIKPGENDTKSTSMKPMPILYAPYWAKLIFMWATGIVVRGYRKSYKFEDLYDLRLEEKCEYLVPKFLGAYYENNNQNGKGKRGYSSTRSTQPKTRGIYYALWVGVGKPAMMSAFFRLLSIPVMFVNPELLRLLIQFIVSGDPNTWKGVLIASLMLLSTVFYSVFINNFTYYGMVAGMRARTQTNAAVYRKALKLSNEAKRKTTVGQIVAVMSVDAQKVQDFFTYLSVLWSLPILVGLAIYLLYYEVGPSAFAGLIVLLVIIPINALYFARKAMQLQGSQMKQKDQRFRLLNEILAGIKVLKLYAWELSFQSTVLGYREKELKDIRAANYINAVGSMFWLLSPYMVSLAVYATYSLTSPYNIMTPETTFVALSLINLLNYPMSLLPMAVSNTVQGIVSLKRVSTFLELKELDESVVEKLDHAKHFPSKHDTVIEVKNCTVSWGEGEKPILNKINMSVRRGQLVAVVGTVGSGKSSLVQTILGELNKMSGSIKVGGSIAYVPQQAWIQFATVRENIIFGRQDIPTKYNKIIDACALKTDLMILPAGDQTEIGEKGINLSGGQKQRVSLARAVYQNEDIYLLDDPLSAVDAHVGKHIFEKVIGPNGYLQDKTRVLVTHGVTYLPHADIIYVIKDGEISESGHYHELLDRNGAFADFIRTYINDEAHESDDDDDIMQLRARFSESESGVDSSGGNPRKRNLRKRSLSRGLSRSKSEDEKKVIEEEVKQKGDSKLITDELAQEGNISMSVFKKYIQSGGYLMFFLVVFGHLGFIASQVLTNIWLSVWSSDVPVNGTSDLGLAEYRLGVYGGLGALQVFFVLGEAFALAEGCYAASRHLHFALIERILRAPMSFFDTTPLGRIMNRFTKDVDVLDANMPMYVRQWLFAMAPVLTTLIIITYSTPIFGVVILPLVVMFIIVQRMYITTARQLKRIDSVKRSPLYVHFDESVVGATSIRAYKREEEFVDKGDRLIDDSQKPWFLVISSYRWCGILMEFLGALIVFFASLFSVLQRSPATAGLAGLSVAYSLQIITYMNAMIQNASELENYVVSVERVAEYTTVEQEADWYKPEEAPPRDWPDEGRIEFLDYCTRYRAGLDLVLRDINCNINPTEKIGIIGRTGAGKSSLSLALFRLIEAAAGRIRIDGMTVGRLGLHDLRSRISIIPQDPVVFSGTLRDNLDPFHQYTDEEVWLSLENAHLKEFVSNTAEGLLYQCGESGEALSVGQRQLLCLARALLRNARILVLDEATAAVDLETDALIQNTIRTQFKHCTILTVAHRLNTVMDYDRIMVLDKGKIRELDAPSRLLQDKRTIFYGMAKDAGLV